MRKHLLIILAALLAFATSIALEPGDLVGTWQTKDFTIPNDDPTVVLKGKSKITFAADGSFDLHEECAATFDIGDGAFVDCYTTLTGAGQYTVDGDSFTLVFDPATLKADMPRDKVRARGHGIFPDLDNGRPIEDAIHNAMQPSLPSMLAQMDTSLYEHVAIDGKKMTCENDGLTLAFSKKK